MKKLIIAVLLILGLICNADAANRYVRKGATGSNSGASWANAWNEMNQISHDSLIAGDIVYMAAGNYTTALQITKGGTSESTRITFKRATVAEHGSDTGWSSGYDGQINIDQIDSYYTIEVVGGNHYVTVDGVTRYGIKAMGGKQHTIACGRGIKSNHVTFRYLYADGTAHALGFTEDGISLGGDYVILEYSKSDGYYDQERHGDALSCEQGSNITIRYSHFGRSLQYLSFTTAENLSVYGNLFYKNPSTTTNNAVQAKFLIGANVFYNNVLHCNSAGWPFSGKPGILVVEPGEDNSKWTYKNNVLIDCDVGMLDGTTHSYNAFKDCISVPSETGSRTALAGDFTDFAGFDFTIPSGSGLRNTGTTLSTPYNYDYLATVRGYDGAFDIGAYEYGGAPNNPTTISAGADRNTNTASETVTGTASDDDTVASVAWVNSRGGSGACTGTTSWSCGSITMYNGLNTITVTATDSLGGTGSDAVVLTYYESVSNNSTITVTGPQLVYFKATSSGDFKITGSVNAADSGTNSFYIDIGTDPAGNTSKEWHINYPTTGYDPVDARWGTWDAPNAYQSPVIWGLTGADQILYIRNRETGTQIESVKFVAMSADATAPSVTIATSSPQSITSDALTVSGTATDAVWGTGSVCKFRVGAEPTAAAGTACTGTTSWSCAATGFSLGANTLYVECGDAVPNWSTSNSIVVNYGTPTPLPPVGRRGGTISGGVFK